MNTYWPGGAQPSASYLFALYCSRGSQGKNTEVVCHSRLQWSMFCQNSPQWPVHLGWPCMAWLIVSSSYKRLWSMWSFWLVFCDCGFHSAGMGLKFLLLLSALWWMNIRGLCRLPDGRDQLWWKLGLALMGRAMLSKSLIQFSPDGWDCAPSL